jgi:hypothetical protein
MADAGAFFGKFFGSAAGAANPLSPAATIIDGVQKILGMVHLSPELKAQLQAQLTLENIDIEKAELAANLAQVQGQLDANKIQAASTNIWVAGPRPAVMWTCAAALAWEFVLKPFLAFVLIAIHHPPIAPLPVLDTATLITGLLIPMLGLGGLRTYEKLQGVPGADNLQ